MLVIPAKSNGQSGANALHEAFTSFNKAFVRADTEVLKQMLTEKYIHTNHGNPPIRSASWLKYIESRRQKLEQGVLQIELYETGELDFQYHGNTGVITGIVQSKGTNNGEPFEVNIRFTQLWVFENDRWKRAAFQDSKIE